MNFKKTINKTQSPSAGKNQVDSEVRPKGTARDGVKQKHHTEDEAQKPIPKGQVTLHRSLTKPCSSPD